MHPKVILLLVSALNYIGVTFASSAFIEHINLDLYLGGSLASCYNHVIMYSNYTNIYSSYALTLEQNGHMTYPRRGRRSHCKNVTRTENVTETRTPSFCAQDMPHYMTKKCSCIGVAGIFPHTGFQEFETFKYLFLYWFPMPFRILQERNHPATYHKNSEVSEMSPAYRMQNIRVLIVQDSCGFKYGVQLARIPVASQMRAHLVVVKIVYGECSTRALSSNYEIILAAPVLGILSFQILNPQPLPPVLDYEACQKRFLRRLPVKARTGVEDEALLVISFQLLLRSIRDFVLAPYNQSQVWDAKAEKIGIEITSFSTGQSWEKHWSIQFLPTHQYALLCDQEGFIQLGIADYMQPFTLKTWVSMLLCCGAVSAIFAACPNYRAVAFQVPWFLYSTLLEVGFSLKNIPGIRGKGLQAFTVLFLLMALVLTNGYKGIVTTSLALPFPRHQIQSLEEAIDQNYTFVDAAETRWGYTDCCQHADKLNKVLNDANAGDLKNVKNGQTCKEYVTSQAQFYLIKELGDLGIRSTKALNSYTDYVSNALNHIKHQHERAASYRHRLIRDLRILPCDVTITEYFGQCERSVYIITSTADATVGKKYVENFAKAEYAKHNSKLYSFMDKTIFASDHNFGVILNAPYKYDFRRSLRQLTESGVIFSRGAIFGAEEKRRQGKLTAESGLASRVKKLGLQSRVCLIFLVLPFGAVLALVSAILESTLHPNSTPICTKISTIVEKTNGSHCRLHLNKWWASFKIRVAKGEKLTQGCSLQQLQNAFDNILIHGKLRFKSKR